MSEIDNAKDEFQKLMDFVSKAKANIYQVPNKPDRNKTLPRLIGVFEEKIAPKYFEKAQEVIPKIINPHERSLAYHAVLSLLRSHALFLVDLARPYRVEILSDYALPVKLIAFISQQRLPSVPLPFLLAVLSSDFKYVHFNYLSNVGLVGLQPDLVAGHLDDLNALWHEVAGYSIALARSDNRLTRWTGQLTELLKQKELLDTYQNLFRESTLYNLPIDRNSIKPEALSELDAVMQNDQEWSELSTPWLGEFLEDLFWVMTQEGERTANGAIETATIAAMAKALTPRYPDLDAGDLDHPPVNLRLLVGVSYLGYGKPEDEIKTIASLYVSDPDPLLELATVIAEFCRNIINSPETPFLGQVSPEEKKVVKAVLELPNKGVRDQLEKLLANVVEPPLKDSFEPINFFEQTADFDSFIKFRFIDTDLRRFVWPPPQQGGWPPNRFGGIGIVGHGRRPPRWW